MARLKPRSDPRIKMNFWTLRQMADGHQVRLVREVCRAILDGDTSLMRELSKFRNELNGAMNTIPLAVAPLRFIGEVTEAVAEIDDPHRQLLVIAALRAICKAENFPLVDMVLEQGGQQVVEDDENRGWPR